MKKTISFLLSALLLGGAFYVYSERRTETQTSFFGKADAVNVTGLLRRLID